MNPPNFLAQPAATPAPAAKSAVKPAPAKAPVNGPNPGLKQIDGNQSGLGQKPTRASLQDRTGSGSTSGRTGMESAMGALADKLHPPKFKGRR